MMRAIDWGLVVNALAAFGSMGAAIAALYIATRDRKERQRERDAQDYAQAKLVIIWADRDERRTGPHSRLQMTVRNGAPRAIVDVEFVSLQVEGHEHLRLVPTSEPTLPFIQTESEGKFIFEAPADPSDPTHRAVIGQWERQPGGGSTRVAEPTILDTTVMTAVARWTDASGKVWVRGASRPPITMNEPKRVYAQSASRRITRRRA